MIGLGKVTEKIRKEKEREGGSSHNAILCGVLCQG